MEPHIDTELCTSTCNVCTELNPKMFAFNDRQEAYIRESYLEDPTTGRYAVLVKAAEQCPCRIIHPGAPLNPHETISDMWIERGGRFG